MLINKLFTPTHEAFFEMIKIMACDDNVKDHVILNHDNNKWWPNFVIDWKLRMLIAGLSTRVSYSMVNTYAKVVDNINSFSYDELLKIKDDDFLKLVRSIGLSDARLKFKKSLFYFLERINASEKSICEFDTEELINQIANNVDGASYKVAQCCVLYAKGYYCGIMPVDSGMKDVLGFCLGFDYPKNNKGHDIFRLQLENLVHKIDFWDLANELGYTSNCNIPLKNQTWWVHLVLIYYKRFYCNKCNPSKCLLHKNNLERIGSMCDKKTPKKGGKNYIIIEGIDGTGKTTLAKKINKLGYEYIHFPHNTEVNDLFAFYSEYHENKNDMMNKYVLDRSFISEFVYGNAIRNFSRISDNELSRLINIYSQNESLILLIMDSKENLLNRLSNKEDIFIIENYYDSIITYYKKFYELHKNNINIILLNSNEIVNF